MQTNRSIDLLSQADAQEESPFNFAQYDATHDLLTSNAENYTNDQIQQISALADILRGLRYPANDDEAMNEDEALAYQFCAQAAGLLSEIAVDESKPPPWRMVVDQLKDRLPSIIFFGENDRNLSSRYDLAEVAASPPRALMHLAVLADLDLKTLLGEVNANAIADIATRRNAKVKFYTYKLPHLRILVFRISLNVATA